MESNIEERRVQRLGTSSLIVTLPKKWVKKVNINPGDKVTMIIEGDEIRILPPTKRPQEKGKHFIELKKLENDILISEVPLCLYILGFTDAVLGANNLDVSTINKIITRASNLLGVRATCLGDNRIKVKVLIDTEENISSMLWSIYRDLVLLMRTILKVIRNQDKLSSLLNDAKMLGNEISKNYYAIVRTAYQSPYTPPGRMEKTGNSLLAPSLSLLAYLMSQIALDTIETLSMYQPSNISNIIIEITETLIDVIEKLSNALRSGDVEILKGVMADLERLKAELPDAVKKDGGTSLYLFAKTQDFLRLLETATDKLTCWLTISSLIEKGLIQRA